MSQKLATPSFVTCQVRHKPVFYSLNNEQLVQLDEHRGCNFYRKGAYSKDLFCVNNGKIKRIKLVDIQKLVLLADLID